MSNHPSFQRMRAAAAALGSTANTVRGVVKFLKGYSRQYSPLCPAIRSWVCPVSIHTAGQWKADSDHRKSDPEAKRARDDKRYRKGFLARLRRREAAALAEQAKSQEVA